MKILAIDPGKTIGCVLLDDNELVEHWECKLLDVDASHFWHFFVLIFSTNLREHEPDVLVLEDYRIYADKANMHIGNRLFTAELIGSIRALCAVVAPPVSIRTLSASKKGRWPDARLDAKFPQHKAVTGTHERDALKLALAYKEMQERNSEWC